MDVHEIPDDLLIPSLALEDMPTKPGQRQTIAECVFQDSIRLLKQQALRSEFPDYSDFSLGFTPPVRVLVSREDWTTLIENRLSQYTVGTMNTRRDHVMVTINQRLGEVWETATYSEATLIGFNVLRDNFLPELRGIIQDAASGAR